MENRSQVDALTLLRGASEMVTMVIEYEVELQGNCCFMLCLRRF